MTLLQLAILLGVQAELVRDAGGTLQGCMQLPSLKLTQEVAFAQAHAIRIKLVQWGKLAVGYSPSATA